jgi:hypothetical protein
VKPKEGIRLRFIGDHTTLQGNTATAHRTEKGWYVMWDRWGSSNAGLVSITDKEIDTSLWEPAEVREPAQPANLKVLNSRLSSQTCASCKGPLREPYPDLKHCPLCEP